MGKRRKKKSDDGFMDPKEEKRKILMGIIAFLALVVIFVGLLVSAFTGGFH